MPSLLFLGCLCCAAPAPSAEGRVATRAEQQRAALVSHLERVGLTATPAAAREFLRTHAPTSVWRQELQPRLLQLGDAQFQQRERVQDQLSGEPWLPSASLMQASQHSNLEVAWRARRLQSRYGGRHGQTLRAVAALAVTPADDQAVGKEAVDLLRPWLAETTDPALRQYLASLLPADPDAKRPEVRASVSDWARAPLGSGTLVATGTRGLAGEFDPQGRLTWRVPFRAWSAERLSSGTTLLASLEEQQVVEVDGEGRRVWSYGPVSATRAKPLTNGHILLADYNGSQVLEVARDQTVVWRYAAPDRCFDAERLINGHTLVACANLIQEVSPGGDVVWQWQLRGRLNGFQALPSGRILVANFAANEVAELDDSAQVVWRAAEPQPSDAFRLPDGHTLVTSATRVVELDERGQVVRVVTTARYGSARR